MARRVIVLGAPYSGADQVTEIIHRLGVNMRKDLELSELRKLHGGLWQDKDFVDRNDTMLRAAYGYWHLPPSKEAIEKLPEQHAAELLTYKGNDAGSWGWYDPRTMLTLPKWLPHIEDKGPKLVLVTRNIHQNQADLFTNHYELLSRHDCMDLIREYNTRAFDVVTSRGLPYIHIQVEALGLHAEIQVQKIADFIGVAYKEAALEAFD